MAAGLTAAAWAAIASAAIAAAGTGLSVSSANEAADNQQRLLNQAAEDQAVLDKKKQQTTQRFAKNNFTPEVRKQALEEVAKTSETSLVDALMRANKGDSDTNAQGNLSSDYVRSSAASAAASKADILKRARLMSRVNAPGLLANRESLAGGQYSSDVAGLDTQSGRNQRYSNMLYNNAADRGSLAGGLLTGLGGAGASYASSMSKPKAKTSPGEG